MAHIEDTSVATEGAETKLAGLRRARIAAGHRTATAAAEALGLKVSTYISHENGSRGTSAAVAKRYADEFGVTVDSLLSDTFNSAPAWPEVGGISAPCPVKDIAETVQHLIDALYAAEIEKAAKHDPNDMEAAVKVIQAEHRYDALSDLISYKKDHAACLQATSPGGAAHQVAIASLLVEVMWECAPELSENREKHWKSKEAHRLLQWTLNSIINVLLSLESTPREKLGIEYYMGAEYSPFVRTSLQPEAA